MQPNRNLCLDCVPNEKQLLMRTCDKSLKTQKWTVQNVNANRMAKWDEDRFNFKAKKKKSGQNDD